MRTSAKPRRSTVPTLPIPRHSGSLALFVWSTASLAWTTTSWNWSNQTSSLERSSQSPSRCCFAVTTAFGTRTSSLWTCTVLGVRMTSFPLHLLFLHPLPACFFRLQSFGKARQEDAREVVTYFGCFTSMYLYFGCLTSLVPRAYSVKRAPEVSAYGASAAAPCPPRPPWDILTTITMRFRTTTSR